mgnify:CR=1 FL=1
MQIIQAEGQTCNQFWIYSHYLVAAMEDKKKITILAPDAAIENYPNIINQKFISFPLYNAPLLKLMGHKRRVALLNQTLNNKYTRNILAFFFKIIPRVTYMEAKMGQFTKTNLHTYKEEIKSIFKPKKEIILSAQSLISEKRLHYDKIIGIHVRRGDYRTHKNGKFFYTDEQYCSIMNQIEELFPKDKVGFLVCSNEFLDLEKLGGNRSFSFQNSSAALDLHGLGLCDYIIGPPSSYSCWASFFGGIPLYFIANAEDAISLDRFWHEPLLWPPPIA